MTTSPDTLSTAVKAITSSQARQHPVVMITYSAGGKSRVFVPDWGELRVIDDRRLRVAVWPSDPTAANLDHDGSVLLIVTALSDVHLVHATARRLVNAAMVWAHYELTITSARIVDRGTAPHPQAGHNGNAGKELLAHRLPKAADKHREYRRDPRPLSSSAIIID
ncbi:hypothetical protein [Actinomadura rudentiformis]|uniref:Pyridoxamine 5'-phosphate oxidase family protein n=1 Tax=Actinomadura rudentiformis TaxID=359158 RepID=A0A6H9Z9V0_9ACTN|nr:hypothetical protein [Actinomadura rudentiformis]KAB2352465.1 hypothetical protein F8566_01925 [Actinomadura rudentiformis]